MNLNLTEIAKQIYTQNLELGWHDEVRPDSVMLILSASELGEATEGLRKDLQDDHLPHRSMFEVEMADFIIRNLDWLGRELDRGNLCEKIQSGLSAAHYKKGGSKFIGGLNEFSLITVLYSMVFDDLEAKELNNGISLPIANMQSLLEATALAVSWFIERDIPIFSIIYEKVEYNKTRADHQPENRAKEGGKKW